MLDHEHHCWWHFDCSKSLPKPGSSRVMRIPSRCAPNDGQTVFRRRRRAPPTHRFGWPKKSAQKVNWPRGVLFHPKRERERGVSFVSRSKKDTGQIHPLTSGSRSCRPKKERPLGPNRSGGEQSTRLLVLTRRTLSGAVGHSCGGTVMSQGPSVQGASWQSLQDVIRWELTCRSFFEGNH